MAGVAVGKIGILAVLVLAFAFIILNATLPDIVPLSEAARTDTSTETGLTCTTGVGETSCSVTLAAVHEYPDTSQMTVTETSPGSTVRTTSTTVANDRLTLTVAGLTASTAYVFTVEYAIQAANVSSQLNAVLRFLPALLIFGVVALVLFAAVRGLSAIR